MTNVRMKKRKSNEMINKVASKTLGYGNASRSGHQTISDGVKSLTRIDHNLLPRGPLYVKRLGNVSTSNREEQKKEESQK